jgi:hypothetical protein
MTCYIGTLAGGRDIGRIRIIYANDTTITIAENSYSWINSWFLTVVQYHEPWTVFPRITLPDDNIPVFYKDYDILYTDQNQYMQPVINMGPHYAGFLDSLVSGTYEQVWYTSSGTFDPTVGGGIYSYDWEFEGGMPAGSTGSHPGWVEYTGSGYYLTRLRVVTNDGKTGTAYRHIMIFDRPGGSGANEPVKAWGFRGFDGDRESGGYTVGLWIREAAGLTTITEGSLVVIFSDDWEGNDPVTKISANAENRGQILYSGYVLEDTTYWNPVTSRLEFETASITGRMGELATFATSIESKTNAMTWTELRDMTVDRAAIHMLRWHSTVLEVHDYAQTEDTKWVKFADFERGTLYESVNNWFMNTLIARMVSDRQGKIWTEVDARVTSTGSERQATGHMQEVLDMSNSDWRGEISIPRRFESELAYLEMGGLNFSGPSSTGGVAAFLAGAPGEAPDYFGSVERAQGLVVSNQGQLNELVGLAFAMKNAVYPEVTAPLAGDYRFLDIAPQQRLLVTVAENDTHRGIVWSQKPFIPQEISYQWLPQFQSLLMDVGLAEETGGEPGFGSAATILIPPDPPYDTPDDPDWEIEIPPIIPPDPWEPPDDVPPSDGNLVYLMMSDGILARTENYFAASPSWETVGTAGVTGAMTAFRLDPFDRINSAMILTRVESGPDDIKGGRIYRTSNLSAASPAWSEVWGVTENLALLPHGQRDLYDLKPKWNTAGQWFVTGRDKSLGSNHLIWVFRTDDYGGSWLEKTNGILPGNPGGSSLALSPWDNSLWALIQEHTFLSVNGGDWWVKKAITDGDNGGRIFPLVERPTPLYAICGGDDANPADGGMHLILLTDDGGVTWEDISPSYKGYQWHLQRNAPQQRAEYFISHPANITWYAVLKEAPAGASAHNPIFVSRASEAGSWVILHEFAGGVDIFGYNPTNPLLFYTKGGGFDMSGSQNGGLTWTDQEGDLAVALGYDPASKNGIAIQASW